MTLLFLADLYSKEVAVHDLPYEYIATERNWSKLRFLVDYVVAAAALLLAAWEFVSISDTRLPLTFTATSI